MEVGTRLIVNLEDNRSGFFQYSKNADLIYEHRPNATHEQYQTNSAGIVSNQEYAIPKPVGTFRICSVGDSVAFMSTGKNYAALLQETFDQEKVAPYKNIEVLDFSVIGYTSLQEKIVVEKKVMKYQPDLILIGYCINDFEYTDGMDSLSKARHPSSPGSILHSRFLIFLQDRFDYYQMMESNSSKSNLRHTIDFFNLLLSIREKHGVELLILLFPSIDSEGTGFYDLEVEKLATDLDIPTLNSHALFGVIDLRQIEYAPQDGFHFNEAGHRLVSHKLYDRITAGWQSATITSARDNTSTPDF